MRIIHLFVIAALVFAAAYVYRIKMESTARTERVLRLHAEIRAQAGDGFARNGPSSMRRCGCRALPTGTFR